MNNFKEKRGLMDVTFINVGYGESILITNQDPNYEDGQFVMLIDGGSALDSEYTGKSGRIRAYDFLKKKGIRHIDLLAFSHVHEDHTCGLVPIISEIPVKKYWTTIAIKPEYYGKQVHPDIDLSETNRKALASVNDYSLLMEKLQGLDIEWLDVIHPDYFCEGDLTIDILGPEKGYKESVEASVSRVFETSTSDELDAAITQTTETMNNASLILRLHYKGKTVLLCGDTNADGYRHILETNPDLLKADIFKVGHHGQADSVSEALVRAVDPSVIVCCASNDFRSNSSNTKTFETIAHAEGEKPLVYLFQDGLYNAQWNPDITPRNGVTVSLDEDGITWQLC